MKLSTQQFKEYLKNTQEKAEYQRIHAVYLFIIKKKKAKEIAKIVNSPPGTINQWTHKYKKFGIEGLLSKKNSVGRPPLMTKDEERKFFEELKTDGENGHIITAKNIKEKVEKKVGRMVSLMYIYNILKRNKWRKVSPRKQNPKSSKETKDEFKQNFSTLVHEVEKTFDPTDTRPLKLLFQDEARFGRINALKRCWAPMGIRPCISFQMVRQFDYVFSVVCPKTGETFTLILPDADTAMMNLFLDETSQFYKDYRIIVIADQASWHKSKTLKNFENIRFIFLPPASPELNPAEHLWDHVRERPEIANCSFDSLNDMEKVLEKTFREIHHNPDSIRSLVSFSWIN